MASLEQKKADENVVKLVEEQKVCCFNLMFYVELYVIVYSFQN